MGMEFGLPQFPFNQTSSNDIAIQDTCISTVSHTITTNLKRPVYTPVELIDRDKMCRQLIHIFRVGKTR
ncbi:hypothetical protein D3C81_2001500 [compost metagenome]